MSIQTEIAQRIDKALDGDCGYGVGGYLADQIAPLIAEHDAKVRARERERCARIAERSAAAQFLAWEIADRIREQGS